MSEEIFKKLRKQLDQYSVGFPETESGVEYRIIKRLFSEEEARMYLDLSLMLEAPVSVAERTGRDPKETEKFLEEMAKKGLLFRHRGNEGVRYSAAPFIVGSYEFQLKNLDRELAGMVEAYFNEGFFSADKGDIVFPLRTIPVNKSLDSSWKVAPHNDAREIIKQKKKVALADCICRVHKGFLEEACDKPIEACFSFGSHADYYVENGLARFITHEEALEVIDRCDEAGLVVQPASMVNPGGMCMCCGDCCGMLRALKTFPKPAEKVINNYFAAVDPDLCSGCETCIGRCQMEAINMADDVAVIDTDRCIGCGLCVTTCDTEAMSLELKPEDQRVDPFATGQEMAKKTAEVRGTSMVPLSMSDKE